MAEPHVVSALREKRSEVSGLIADLERRIAQQRADLVHVDAVLRLYAPDLELASIAVKAVRRDHGWFKRGELSRLVLDVLRITPVPMTLKAIATEVMARRQLDPTDERTVHRIVKLARNTLTRQADDLVERIAEGRMVTWRVRR